MTDNNLERDLDEFRKQWLRDIDLNKHDSEKEQVENNEVIGEVGNSTAHINESKEVKEILILPMNWNKLTSSERKRWGLDFYKQAVEQESKGQLGEALNSYRSAFKVDPDVDLSYKSYLSKLGDKQRARGSHVVPFNGPEDFEFIKNVHISEDYQPINSDTKNKVDWKNMDPMYQSMKKMIKQSKLDPKDEDYRAIACKKADNKKNHCLSNLSDDILIKILSIAISSDLQSIGAFSNTCVKGLFLSRDKMIWNKYGKTLYHPTTSSYRDFITNNNIPLEEYIKLNFNNHWRFFLIEYPRVRFDGIYISTCYYIRQGISENSFNRPIHLVTYYRYLRFYPDGTCIKRLSTDEPNVTVHNMNKQSKFNDLFFGQYKLNKDNNLEINVSGEHRRDIDFNLSLQLKSTTRGKHNKLSWLEYSSIFDMETTIYSLKQFKPFYFSKVKSYHRDWVCFINGE